MTMNEMLAFGIEITHAPVMCLLACSGLPLRSDTVASVAAQKRVEMTFHRLPFVLGNFVPCTCITYSKINSF